ncbi:MAG: O-acetyl-ADP-ribose deacetylase [Planctomycetota bacterium]
MRVRIVTDDITRLEVDAIVNAANTTLLGGGGVDGAIHRAAGPELLAACRALPEVAPGVRCRTGEARMTPGLALPARHVIHTVGPIWRGGSEGEEEDLAACYRNCMSLAVQHDVETIAFPAISCGIYGFPVSLAARIAWREIGQVLKERGGFQQVLLTAFDPEVEAALKAAARTE